MKNNRKMIDVNPQNQASKKQDHDESTLHVECVSLIWCTVQQVLTV
jgi:hypothetical protein